MKIVQNDTILWKGEMPIPQRDANKYDRGHVIILGGTDMPGAARLASEASMKTGCGVCTIISSSEMKVIYLSGAPHIMFEAYKELSDFPSHLHDAKRNACIIGPGAGRKKDAQLRQAVLGILNLKNPTVLDADALNVFQDCNDNLISALHDKCVLTPHEGEFSRLFPDLKGSSQERARQAAQMTGAVILLKGAQTIICTPNGETIVNHHSTPYLATAGSGDVLSGMIGGFLAQGMLPAMACAAATWLHGEAALQYGLGLTAPDVIAKIPDALRHALS